MRPSRRGEPDRRALRLENKPPDDEGWGGGEILARYEGGVMLFLLILTVTIVVALLVWLGAITKERRPKPTPDFAN